MNIISFIFYLVVAPPAQPPLWLWIIIGVLMIASVFLIIGSQTDYKFTKKKID